MTSPTIFVPSVPRLVFWSVTPAAVAVGGVMLLGFSHYSFAEKLVVVGIEVLLALVIAALAAPHRYLGASRLLAASMAALYVLYFVDRLLVGSHSGPTIVVGWEQTVADGWLGLVFFALPCAIFAVRGSLMPRSEEDDRSQAMGSD